MVQSEIRLGCRKIGQKSALRNLRSIGLLRNILEMLKKERVEADNMAIGIVRGFGI